MGVDGRTGPQGGAARPSQRRRCLSLALGFLAAFGPARGGWAAAPPAFEAVVFRVSDGDTAWVRPDDGAPVKVRLLGIDAPEQCQAHGAAATAALASRVLHRRVRIEGRARDDYGRLLAHIVLEGEDLNGWMVRSGHAWGLRPGRRRGRYADEHREAVRAGRGLFGDPLAVSPWEFRRRHGACGRAAGPQQSLGERMAPKSQGG